jgi:AraC family transcriptional regulator, regulatory protein of adaptative response / DNA-3-methyladenine glycosylase II
MRLDTDAFEATYRAVESRDRRLDGRVFVGVTSTGIYCRPICPMPMPKRRYVRFFTAAVTAESEGFRACRRCRPETSPDAPDWDVRADLVGRGLRLIADGVVDREGVTGLASRLAVGSRHLHREFVAELGGGPLAVARSRRAALAKQLLEQTDLASTDVAFASGFSSVRAYHDTLRGVYGRTPTELRRHRRPSDSPAGLELRLMARPPFASGPLLCFLGDRAIPGVERLAGATYRRSVVTEDGTIAVLELTPEPDEPVVRLRVHGVGGDVPMLAGLVQTARRLFDLDADPATIDAALAEDPAVAPIVAATPGTRLPGAADGFELAVRAIVGQQVSVGGAQTTLGRIAARLGAPIETDGGITHTFPTAADVAAASPDDLGVPAARAAAIRELARRVEAADLDLSPSADLDAARAGLLSIPGVGAWTAAYVGMRALRDPDAFPAGDLGIRRAFEALGLPADVRSIAERAERWRPWRGYAAMLLWRCGSREDVSGATRTERPRALARGESDRARRSAGT